MPNPDIPPLPTRSRSITLYALGSNGNFQLGLPHNEDTNHPQKCIFNITQDPSTSSSSPTLDPSPPSFASTTTTTTQTQTHIPLRPTESITSLTAGGNHTLLLTSHGRVFAAGSNEFGQLALSPPSDTPSLSPSIAPSPPQHTAQPPPGFHALLWTGSSTSKPSLHNISHISCTFTATDLISNYTTLYVAGHGPKGELGLGSSVITSPIPTKAFDIRDIEGQDARIEQMVACMDHVLLLSSSGAVYGCGAARKGQLGWKLAGEEKGICWVVRGTDMHVGLGWRVGQVVTGREVSVLAGEDGNGEVKVEVFGRSGDTVGVRRALSQSFPDDESDSIDASGHANSTVIPRQPTLHAGWSSLTAHHASGHLSGTFLASPCTTSQRPTHNRGQLPPPSPPLPLVVTSLALGSEHTVAFLHDGTVISWGWGEHGNCGAPIDKKGVVGNGRWNVLFEPAMGERVVGVGAGCGSSFFWVEEEIEEVAGEG